MKIPARFENRSGSFWRSAGLGLVGLVGTVDVLTGFELAFSLFYLIPISLVTWFIGRPYGVAASMLSATVWLAADAFSGHPYTHLAIPFWNTIIRFGFFLVTALLISALRQALEREKNLARIDDLTGAENLRSFNELLRRELDRLQRFEHPLTIVYMDLDDFKAVNDRFGHSMGDQVLSTVVKEARKLLRSTDVIARLGGDEFALLLPETDEAAARAAMSKVQKHLLNEMRRSELPVTFSMGVLTCREMPPTSDDLLNQADALMYSVKNEGKNSIRYSTYSG